MGVLDSAFSWQSNRALGRLRVIIIFVISYRKDHFSAIVHWGGFDFQAAIGVYVVGYLHSENN